MSLIKKMLFAVASFAVISSVSASPLKLGSVGFSGIYPVEVELPGKGEFSNEFYFSLQEGNSLQIGLTSFFWGDNPADAPDIRFTLSGGSGAGVFTPFIMASTDDFSFSAGMTLDGLDSLGNYILQIDGTDASILGDTYSLQLAATGISSMAAAVSVPEPASQALVLTALGAMGLIIRRRKTKAKEVA